MEKEIRLPDIYRLEMQPPPVVVCIKKITVWASIPMAGRRGPVHLLPCGVNIQEEK
jgi:hypothetical protein